MDGNLERHGAEVETLAWALAGDREAFSTLVRRHGQAVHAFLARRAGRTTADELLAEVWLRAWRSRDSYDPGWVDPRPWLYGIARNVLRAHWRLRADRQGPPFQLTDDPWAAVDDRIDAGRLRAALADALDEMADEYREVLLLVAWEQLRPSEVAVTLGIPASTVRSRLHRARLLVQRAIETTTPHPIFQEA